MPRDRYPPRDILPGRLPTRGDPLAPCARELFFWLFRKVNFKQRLIDDGKGQTSQGQLFTDYKKIQDALSWKVGFRTETYSMGQIEAAIKTLTKTTLIQAAKTTRGFIITVCDYGSWINMKTNERHTKTTPNATL